MTIAVIGSGAIGGLVAAYLKSGGQDVVLIGRHEAVAAIKKSGLAISGARGAIKVDIDIRHSLEKPVDLVVLAVKTQDIAATLRQHIEHLKGVPVVTTQNGVRAEDILTESLDKNNIISSVVMFGATYLEPGKIVHNFEGKWILGRPYAKNDAVLEKIAEVLKTAFPTVVTNDIWGMKWLKIFVNSSNCLPAILGKSMQETFKSAEVARVSMCAWKEGLGVVNRAGIKLVSLPDFPLERLQKLTALPSQEAAKIYSAIMSNLSREPLYGSILQSIKRGRASEIDYINGEFVALGRSLGTPVPINDKLVRCVHGVEQSGKFLSETELLNSFKDLLD